MDYGQIIFDTCINQGIPPALANLIVAQSKHETGNYTSNAFLSCNNCFGYKYIQQALSTGPCGVISTEGDAYAAYNTIQDSTMEILGWIKRRQLEGTFPQDLNTITTAEQYAGYLQNGGFFTANITEYVNGLTRWLNAYKTPLLVSGGILTIAFWGMLAYKFFKKPGRKN